VCLRAVCRVADNLSRWLDSGVPREAGFAALAGTNDFRTIALRATGGDASASASDRAAAKLTYDLFVDRVVNYVGAYVVKLLGTAPTPASGMIDGIVFSGGIGEKSVELRRDVARYFAWMGADIDERANEDVGKGANDGTVVFEITTKGAKLKIFVCVTVSFLYASRINSRFDRG
jgi:acetate kinase